MTEPVYTTRKVGYFSIQDTGVPAKSVQSYKTLVLVHGFTWHSGKYTDQVNTRFKSLTLIFYGPRCILTAPSLGCSI